MGGCWVCFWWGIDKERGARRYGFKGTVKLNFRNFVNDEYQF